MNKESEKLPQRQEYVKLSPQGEDAHKRMVMSCFRTFLFWFFVGNVAGYTMTKFVPLFSKRMTTSRQSIMQRYAFWGPLILFTYHGYKSASFYKRRGLRKITSDPANIIKE
jgi:hypothetical protein